MKRKKFNPDNERCKRKYFSYLNNAKGYSDLTVDAIAAAIYFYEDFTEFSGLETFSKNRAIAYKRHVMNEKNKKSGDFLSKSTIASRLKHVQHFFKWLSEEKGHRSLINPTDADYLNMSKKDRKAARATREKRVPTLEEFEQVLLSMPYDTDIEKRNRALIALIGITGIRVTAAASLKRKHIDVAKRAVFQNPNEVKTKFSKQIMTCLIPISELATSIFLDWVEYLDTELKWDAASPLFPRTDSGAMAPFGSDQTLRVLTTEHWSGAGPIRKVFQSAFNQAGMEYHNPHSFRDINPAA